MINNSNSNKLSFSILMANYNNAKYIEEAINSVISQIYSNWELIIVDDCSTDESLEKIKPYLKDNRFKLIIHKKNIGYGGSLKTAAENASNKILGVFDADDKLHKEALEKMKDAYRKNPDCGFIYSTYWKCNSELKNCIINKSVGPLIIENTSIFSQKISHFKTFKKEAYEMTDGFDPNQKKSVDKDIIFKLEEVTKFKFINIPLYYHRLHEGGISQGKNRIEALVYHYITSCKTFNRRSFKNLPNFTLRDLYIQYLRITFYRLDRFVRTIYKYFKISLLLEEFKFLREIRYKIKEIFRTILNKIIKAL